MMGLNRRKPRRYPPFVGIFPTPTNPHVGPVGEGIPTGARSLIRYGDPLGIPTTPQTLFPHECPHSPHRAPIPEVHFRDGG